MSPLERNVERIEGLDEGVARELESFPDEIEGLDLEAAHPRAEDDLADDEIGRAAEEISADEG